MRSSFHLRYILPAATVAVLILLSGGAGAQENVGPSGLPIPRFVSLQSSQVNMRVGPGTQYAVEWRYVRRGLPVEIIQEYDNWRRIRDSEGAEGWVFHSLLSGRRTGIAAPWAKGKQSGVPLLADAEQGARTIAQVEPGAIGNVVLCDGAWCQMNFSGHIGWMDQDRIWGVYPGETIEQ